MGAESRMAGNREKQEVRMRNEQTRTEVQLRTEDKDLQR